MKHLILTILACILLSFSFNSNFSDAADSTKPLQAQVITQDPVEPTEEPFEIKIEGPTKIKVGELAVLSVENSTASSYKWIVIPSTKNYLVIDEGQRLVFSSAAGGEFIFIVAGSLDNDCAISAHTITVIGQKPSPTDDLESKITLWCDQVVSDTKREDCLKLAQSFSSIAMVMEGGTLTTPADIVNATQKSTEDALGEKLENWMPFRQGLANELTGLANNGKLPDTEAHIKIWKAIAVALRNYASQI